MKTGDKVRIKGNLRSELLRLEFTEETAISMENEYVDTEQKIYSLWTDKESNQEYATIDLCVEIPVQCLEVIKESK